MSYAILMAEDRRLCLLRALDGSPHRKANHYVLQTILGSLGHSVSRDQVLSDLCWLEEMGLAKAEVLQSSDGAITVATLTNRGEDAAAGRVTIPGIKRPLPGE